MNNPCPWFKFVLCLIIFKRFEVEATPNSCPDIEGTLPVFIPHKDCTKFWQCSKGSSYLHNCPNGLHFNPELKVCDWPRKGGCDVDINKDHGDRYEGKTIEGTGFNICVQHGLECPSNDEKYPVYGTLSDCTKFCQCSNGIPYLHDCPEGLHFNSQMNVCDWPENAGCAAKNNATEDNGTGEIVNGDGSASEESTIEELEIDICVQNGIECLTAGGKSSIYRALPDCTKYCHCSNGIPYSRDCPEGLHFNSALNVCDWPERAGCSARRDDSDESKNDAIDNGDYSGNGESISEESETNICLQTGSECPTVDEGYSVYIALPDCTKFCQCSNGIPQLHDCPKGLHFDSDLNICDWPKKAGCAAGKSDTDGRENGTTENGGGRYEKTTTEEVEIDICFQNGIQCPLVDGEEPVYVALTDCTKFCQCSNGIPQLHECPKGLHFDSGLNICDWPKNAGCAAEKNDTDGSENGTTENGGGRYEETTTEGVEIDICFQNGIQCSSVDGEEPVYVALPDCTKFCQCSNGIPELHECPKGLHFDSDLNICDWPKNVGCAAGKSDTDGSENGTTENGDGRYEETTTEEVEIDICFQNGILDGEEPVYVSLPDCTKFCQCSNGIPHLHECPLGLHFNQDSKVCDWPSDANCSLIQS